MTWLTATLGPKGQITLPKKVRVALGTLEKGETVGFLLDEKAGAVRLARMEIKPAGENYTEEELRKMLKISREKGGKHFDSAEGFLNHLKHL